MVIEECVNDENDCVSVVLILALRIGHGVVVEILMQFGQGYLFEGVEYGISMKGMVEPEFVKRWLCSYCMLDRSRSDMSVDARLT